MIELDKDETAVNNKIKEYWFLFGPMADAFKMVSFRADIAELIYDARVETAMLYGDLTREDAEQEVNQDLEEAKS